MKAAPKKAPRIKAGRIQRANYKWIYLFLLPTIVIFAMFYVMPIAQVFVTSFTKWDGFNAPKFNGLTNYINLFTNSSFLIALKNLLWWCVIALTLHVGFGTLVAFVLYQRPHGWKFTRTVFMIPNVISAAAWAMIYKFIFNNDFGILNSVIRVFNPNFNVQWFYKSPWAFWAVTFTWLFYAVIVTLVVLGDLMNIPQELNEAAFIDGATGWQLIRHIQLPLCRASIGTSVIASLTSRIAMYEQIALTTSGGPGDDTMSLPIILVKGIMDAIPYTHYTGDPVNRLPGTASFVFEAIEGEGLILRLDPAGICGSTGSACSTGSLDPSHVLMAIGLPHEIAHCSLRISFGVQNTMDDAKAVCDALDEVVPAVRQRSPLWRA